MKLAYCFAVAVVTVVVSANSFAQPSKLDAESKILKELPKSGTLSNSVTNGSSATKADGAWGVDSLATASAPIGGSTSRVSDREWMMKVFNNSEKKSFRVQVELVQLDKAGARIKGDSFTYTLKPQSSAERSIAVQSNTKNCSLNLVDWKETGSSKR